MIFDINQYIRLDCDMAEKNSGFLRKAETIVCTSDIRDAKLRLVT